MLLKAQVKSLSSRHLILVFTALVMLLILGSQIVLPRVWAQSAIEPVVIISKKSANIRFGPGMQSGILATVKKGTPLPLIGQFSNRGQIWFQVHLRGLGDYWVASWVVDINVDISTVPVVTYKGESGAEGGGNGTVPQRIVGSGSGGGSTGNSGSGGGSAGGSGSGGGATNNPPPPPPPAPATTPEP